MGLSFPQGFSPVPLNFSSNSDENQPFLATAEAVTELGIPDLLRHSSFPFLLASKDETFPLTQWVSHSSSDGINPPAADSSQSDPLFNAAPHIGFLGNSAMDEEPSLTQLSPSPSFSSHSTILDSALIEPEHTFAVNTLTPCDTHRQRTAVSKRKDRSDEEETASNQEQKKVKKENLSSSDRRTCHRWTEEENLKLKKYAAKNGNNWDSLNTVLPGVTVLMAKNHLYDLSRRYRESKQINDSEEESAIATSSNSSPKSRGIRTEDENQKLLGNVSQSEKNWSSLGTIFPGITPNQAYSHLSSLSRKEIQPEQMSDDNSSDSDTDEPAAASSSKPKNPYHLWTEEENQKLLDFAAQNGKNWSLLSTVLPGITSRQAYSHLSSLSRKEIKPIDKETSALAPAAASFKPRNPYHLWTEEENQKLLELVSKDWKLLTTVLPGITRRQAQTHLSHLLKSAYPKASSAHRERNSKHKWTEQESQTLQELVSKHGCKWQDFVTFLPGIEPRQMARRWHDYLKRETKRAPLTPAEIETLVAAVNTQVSETGNKSWTWLALKFPNRTPGQLKNSWNAWNRKQERLKK